MVECSNYPIRTQYSSGISGSNWIIWALCHSKLLGSTLWVCSWAPPEGLEIICLMYHSKKQKQTSFGQLSWKTYLVKSSYLVPMRILHRRSYLAQFLIFKFLWLSLNYKKSQYSKEETHACTSSRIRIALFLKLIIVARLLFGSTVHTTAQYGQSQSE